MLALPPQRRFVVQLGHMLPYHLPSFSRTSRFILSKGTIADSFEGPYCFFVPK